MKIGFWELTSKHPPSWIKILWSKQALLKQFFSRAGRMVASGLTHSFLHIFRKQEKATNTTPTQKRKTTTKQEKKHQTRAGAMGESKDNKRGFQWPNKNRRATKQNKHWWEEPFRCDILMFFFAWNKSKETRQETKTKNKEGKRETRNEENKKITREREREWKGEVRQGRENKREKKGRETLTN